MCSGTSPSNATYAAPRKSPAAYSRTARAAALDVPPAQQVAALAGRGIEARDATGRLWRLGAPATSTLGLAIMIFGDRMQFVVVALAAGSDLPWLAAVGATIGGLAVAGPAAIMGETQWLKLPQRAIRIGTAVVLTLAGVVFGLSALRLI